MKRYAILIAILFAASCFAPVAAPAHDGDRCGSGDRMFRDDDVSIDFDDGAIAFTHDESGDRVEITAGRELIVNGRKVHLDRNERKLVEDYGDAFDDIFEEAKALAAEGAKIGVKGASLGIKAAIGALLLISPDYDKDDLEEAIEDDSEEIDRVAKKLEKRAKRLEKRAEALERLHGKLRSEVRELDDLGWF